MSWRVTGVIVAAALLPAIGPADARADDASNPSKDGVAVALRGDTAKTVYASGFDGTPLPGGGFHDGCTCADDTGRAVRRRLIDVRVVELSSVRRVDQAMRFDRDVTPHIEDPRCDYLRDTR